MYQKKKLLSLTKKDFVIQTFRSGGPGGQHQNKRDTGVRIIHPPSGARGECREHRSQKANKEEAFTRMALSKEFQAWMKQETAKILEGEHAIRKRVQREVERWITPRNLRVEVRRDQRWEMLNTEPPDTPVGRKK